MRYKKHMVKILTVFSFVVLLFFSFSVTSFAWYTEDPSYLAGNGVDLGVFSNVQFYKKVGNPQDGSQPANAMITHDVYAITEVDSGVSVITPYGGVINKKYWNFGVSRPSSNIQRNITFDTMRFVFSPEYVEASVNDYASIDLIFNVPYIMQRGNYSSWQSGTVNGSKLLNQSDYTVSVSFVTRGYNPNDDTYHRITTFATLQWKMTRINEAQLLCQIKASCRPFLNAWGTVDNERYLEAVFVDLSFGRVRPDSSLYGTYWGVYDISDSASWFTGTNFWNPFCFNVGNSITPNPADINLYDDLSFLSTGKVVPNGYSTDGFFGSDFEFTDFSSALDRFRSSVFGVTEMFKNFFDSGALADLWVYVFQFTIGVTLVCVLVGMGGTYISRHSSGRIHLSFKSRKGRHSKDGD